MKSEVDALEQGLDPSPYRWLETAIITLVPIALALLFRPEDPLFVRSDFPWLLLGPLLVGLRYGFAHGFASGLFIALAMGLRPRLGQLDEGVPGARMVGTLVVGMLAGEFSDRWLRRIQRLRVVGRYRQQRLEEFSRAYHLLKVSHDRLEERMAGNTTSLRGALLSLRRLLTSTGSADLSHVGEAVMDLFAEHGWVQVAGLHALDRNGRPLSAPTAHLGAPIRIDDQLLLVQRALTTRALVTVRELPESQGPLAAVPLEAIDGELLGIVVIHEMPFVAFTEEHLHLLVVLGGHTADLLVSARHHAGHADPSAVDFLQALRRAHVDRRRFGLVSSISALVLGPRAVEMGIERVIGGTKRGLDVDWKRPLPEGGLVIFLLMPLTDAQGVEGYEQRIRTLLRERFAGALPHDEIRLYGRAVMPGETPEAQLEALGRQCGVLVG